ncbi:MAG: DMT family transporter [Steroidobacteraceae bacterium]
MPPSAWAVFIALGIIWGLPYFFIKVALVELSPLFIVWSRVTLAAAVLLPIAWRRGALAPAWQYKGPVLAFAVIEFAIPFTLITLGEQWIDSSVTGVLIAMTPLSIALISRFFGLHEPLRALRLAGLLIGFAGVLLLLGFGTVSGALGWLGVGCMLVATLGYALGALIIQRHLTRVDSTGVIAASLAVAALLLTPGAMATWPTLMPSLHALFSIGFLGVVCSAVAMLLMFRLIRTAGSQRASVITYVNPAVATLLGVWVLDESLGWSGLAAFALILLGSWLATLASPASAH